MRCKHCGSPIPLGSSFCLDCGASAPRTEREPWETRDRFRSKSNTGEKHYHRQQARRTAHERMHTAASTSRQAESDYGPRREHRNPAAPKQAPRPQATFQTRQTQENPRSTAQAKKRRSNLAVPLVIIIGLSILSSAGKQVMRVVDIIREHSPTVTAPVPEPVEGGYTVNSDADYAPPGYGVDSGELPVEDGVYSTITFDTEEYGQITGWYDGNGQLYNVDYTLPDSDDAYRTEYYEDGELTRYDTMFYDEDGGIMEEDSFQGDGTISTMTFYSGGEYRGTVYFDEDGAPWFADGTDMGGNDLNEIFGIE